MNDELLRRLEADSAGLRQLLADIRDGVLPDDPELLALAERVIASQPKEPQTPEQIEAWARRLAADMIAADCPTCGAPRDFIDCGHREGK